MKRTGKFLLFFSSYCPAWIVMLLTQYESLFNLQFTHVSLLSIMLLLITIATLIIFFYTYKYDDPNYIKKIKILKISSSTSEIVSYLLTLVLPLASTTSFEGLNAYTISSELISNIVFGFFLMLIYVNSNLVVVNPILILMNYTLYKIEYQLCSTKSYVSNIEGVLIIKGKFNPEEIPTPISTQLLDKGVYMYRVENVE